MTNNVFLHVKCTQSKLLSSRKEKDRLTIHETTITSGCIFPFLIFKESMILLGTQLTFTCSKSTIEALEKIVKYIQS